MNVWNVHWSRKYKMPMDFVRSIDDDDHIEHVPMVTFKEYEDQRIELQTKTELQRRQNELDIEVLTAKLHQAEQHYFLLKRVHEIMRKFNRDLIDENTRLKGH